MNSFVINIYDCSFEKLGWWWWLWWW